MTERHRERLAATLGSLGLPRLAWRPWTFFLLHHALAAATLASAVLGLELWGKLEWLDAAMLRTVTPTDSGRAPVALPQLVLIDPELYADRFLLRSPLDSARLAEIVADLLSTHPTALLVDLQVEPAAGEGDSRPLDRLLVEATHDPSRATRVVLPLPEHRTPMIDRISLDWMRSLCRAGVLFGSAELNTHFGTVVRIAQTSGTLAELALEDAGHHDGHGGPGVGAATGARHATPCDRAEQVSALADLLDSEAKAAATAHTEPLASGALRKVLAHAMPWRPSLTRMALGSRPPSIVVLGGDYDERDRFFTTGGTRPIPGAAVHAGALASHGSITTSHAAGWAVDVFLGTCLGVVFATLWHIVSNASPPAWQCSPALPSWRPIVVFALRNALTLLAAAAVWLFALAIAWSVMRGAGFLIAWGVWMNPGPVIFGMFLHALLVKNAHPGQPTTFKSFAIHAPGWLVQAVVIALAGVALLMPHG